MGLRTVDRASKYEKLTEKISDVKREVSKVIVGQEEVIEQVVVSILCDGNILLESNPGMGKTMTVRTISNVIGLDFSRIQSTPDLMPSDITGTHIIQEDDTNTDFVFQKGPIFANMVLVDEINRATPKTQSALLEAMEEKQVTVGNESYELKQPFFLMATQNPIEQEGTYPLPEAQRDRFMMKVKLDYPSINEEEKIVERFTNDLEFSADLNQVLSSSSLVRMQEFTREVPIADDIQNKAVKLVRNTREHEELDYGASPRASMQMVLAAKARALLQARSHVSSSDIDAMAKPVLRHRVGLNFQAEKEGKTEDDIIQDILSSL